MCSKESGSIPRPGTVGQLSLNIMCATPPNDVILQRQVITTYLTSIGTTIIPPPGQSQPPPHDQGSSSIERSWERRERCPGFSSRKKGEHRSEVDRAVVSTSNKKCLHYLDCSHFLKLWCYPCGGKDGACVACSDIRKLGKLFDKKSTIRELWYLVPVKYLLLYNNKFRSFKSTLFLTFQFIVYTLSHNYAQNPQSR